MEIYLGMPGRDGHDGFWMKEVVSIAKMLAKWCAVYGLGKLTATLIRKWITSDIHAKAGHSRLVLADFDVPAGGGLVGAAAARTLRDAERRLLRLAIERNCGGGKKRKKVG